MQAACDHFGNPERAFEVIHVAGTNGKGTVCAFVASMAIEAGRHVGLYTSPHLTCFSERISIDRSPIDESALIRLLNQVMDEAPELTFFEVATLTAFLAFREAKVDLAVVEVGLGGRLDATNVVPPPRVAAITRIAFDHMKELGDTLGKIAAEKAGIIKPGSALVLGKLHPEAREVIEKKADDVGGRIVPLGSPEPIPGAPLAYPRVAMLGSNLAVATTIARELGLPQEAMARGVENTVWPGRNELLHRSGQDLTLLDSAHNPDGAVALAHALDPTILAEVESRRDIALVFGAINTKNWRAMLRRLEQIAAHRIFVAPPITKAVDPQEMANYVSGEVAQDVRTALDRARALVGSRGVVVVTGSTFLVGAARAHLLSLPTDPPVDM
jgi:dihydrofolate synthase/folylpolyglutamate synthase